MWNDECREAFEWLGVVPGDVLEIRSGCDDHGRHVIVVHGLSQAGQKLTFHGLTVRRARLPAPTSNVDVMILDTASLYYRSFYALPTSMTAPDGHPHNAIRGVLQTIERLRDMYNPHKHSCVRGMRLAP